MLVFCRNGWTNRAGFWHVSFLPAVLHCVKKKFGYLQNRGTSFRNFVPNSDLGGILLRYSYLDRRNVLSTWHDKDGRSECDKLDLVDSTSDARPLFCDSNHQALSTAQFRLAGLLATADTCFILFQYFERARIKWNRPKVNVLQYLFYFIAMCRRLHVWNKNKMNATGTIYCILW